MLYDANPVLALSNAYTGANLHVSRLMLERLRQLRALQLQTDDKALETLERATQAIEATNDPAVRSSLQATLAWEQYAQAMAYCNSLFEWARQNQAFFLNGWRDMLTSWQATGGGTAASAPESLVSSAPVDAWLKSLSDAATYTSNAMTAATRQMGDAAQAYFSAVYPAQMGGMPAAKRKSK